MTKSFFLKKSATEPEIGFTTGSCAVAASMACARMMATGKIVPYVILTTPKGIKVCIEIENQVIGTDFASCSVTKNAGADSDVTNGIALFAKVRKIESESMVTNFQRSESNGLQSIKIVGGKGIGRVTLPGLDQKVGEWAINSVPRKLIFDGVKKELSDCGEICSVEVEISAPAGEEIAKKTFNPKLGIVGGISILGTSGIVEPMSEQAILDTIQVELNVLKSQRLGFLVLVPGNYGSEFLETEFGFSLETAVHCSNFVYDSVQMAAKTGFTKMLFCGHIGKLVKVAAGIKNTHSKYGDHRMEIISDIAKNYIPNGTFPQIQKELMSCISTEQAITVLDSLDGNHRIRSQVCAEIVGRIQKNVVEWSGGAIQTEVVIFTKETGLLAETGCARDFIEHIKNERIYKK